MGYLEDMQSPILHRENQSSGSTRFALQNPSLLDANAVGERDQLAQDSGTSFGMADAGFDDLKQEARIKRAESVPGADKFVDKAQENVAFLDADADGLSSTYQSLLDNGMLDESEFSPDQFDAIKNGRNTLERARLQMEYANLGNSYVNGQVKTPEDLAALRDKLSVLKERMRTLDADKDDPTFLFSALEQGYRMVTSDFPAILKGGAKGASWGMVAGMGIGATGGAAVGSVVPLAGTAAGATAGAIAGGLSGAAAGFKAGAAGAMYEQSQKLETGSMMADQLLEKDDLGQYVDPEAAKIAAQGYGLVAGLVEVGGDVVGAKIAFGPALKFLQSKFGKTAGKAVVGGAVKAAMRDKMLGPAVMGFVRRMGAGAGAEGLEEGTQESANILAENFLKKYLNSTGQNYFRDDQSFFSWDNMRRIGQSTWEGAAVGLWFHMLPGLTKLGSDMYGVSRAREFSEKHKAVADAVAQSKTKEISPVRMQSYLETQGFNQTVVIPADAALELQQKGVDIAGPLGWDVNDLQEAATLGHEIQVKASVLQAHLPTDVMKQVADIMRESEVSPNVLDAARADELLAQDRDELMADVEQFAIDEGMAEHEFDRLRTEITEMVRSIPQLMAQITASADPETSLSSFVDSSMRLLRSHYNQTAQHAVNGRQEADTWLSSLHFQGDVRDAQGKEMTPEQVLAQWEQEAAASPEAGLWEGVWGKVDLEGLRKTNPNLAAELARTHGRGLFAPAGEGKSLADLSAEMQAAGVVAQDVDEKALGEALRTRQHPRIYDARRAIETAGKDESRAPLSRESLVGQIEEEFAEAEKMQHAAPSKPQPVMHEDVETVDDLYRLAKAAQPQFNELLANIGEATGGEVHLRPGDGLKKPGRVQEKIDRDYKEEGAKRVIDVLGGTLLYDTATDVKASIDAIKAQAEAMGGKVERIKDRFAKPSGGYKDFLLSIRMPNGFVTEVLVTTKAMSEAKMGPGHDIYEANQAIAEALSSEGISEDERNALKRLRVLLDDASQGFYESTGQESNETASFSVISEPLDQASALMELLSSSSVYPKLADLLGRIRKQEPSSESTNGMSSYSTKRRTNTGALGPDASQGVLERSLPSMERASEGISEPPIDNDIVSPKGPESNRQTPKKTLNSKIEDGILRGDETTLIGSRGDEKAHYEIREAGSLIPSHDPANGFAKRADYPEGVQERPYHSDVEEQNKVRQHAADLKPALLISDNAEASNGPSIITKDGIVLGGNSRVMTMQTAYADYPGKADDYRAMLKDRAERFGMAPEAVDSFEQPVLVRVVDEDMDVQGMAVRSRLYNETTTQGLQAKAEGVSRARMISDDTLAVMAADMEDFDTVREYLASPASKRLVESLITDGVIETTQIARLVSDGKLTDEGKALVENALRGLIVQDYDVLQAAPASVLQKLDRAILSLAQLKKRGGGWDMSNVVTEALRIIGKADARDTSVSMLIGQNSLMQGMNDAANAKKSVQAVALTMENATPKEIAARFAHMAKAAGRPGEGSTQGLLGIAPESNSPATAFVEAFLETIATVDGKPVKAFDPEKNEKHAAIAFAYKHGGRGHSITAAQGAIEKLLHKKKITPENREMLRGYLSALGPLSGTVALYPPKLGQFFSYQPGQELFQFIGGQGAANLDKAEEATTRLDNLAVAREMEQAGKDAKAIKLATGWERGADGKWRYEIDDSGVSFHPTGDARFLNDHPEYRRYRELERKALLDKLTDAEQAEMKDLAATWASEGRRLSERVRNGNATLENIIDAPELFEAYPVLRAMPVVITKFADDVSGYGGFFSSDINGGRIVLNEKYRDDKEKMQSVLLHEIQHAIQREEGFERGGSAAMFEDIVSEFNDEIKFLRNNLAQLEKWSGIKDFVRESMQAVVDGKKKFADHWRDLDEFKKTNPDYLDNVEDIKRVEKEISDAIDDFKAEHGNAMTAQEMYRHLMGEVEARNTSRRMNMSMQERLQSLASETEDVAREDQITIREGLEGGATSMAMPELNQLAYHGTPHRFDNFTLEHIGEGEGAQVHGWGLYFTANKEIGDKRYRERLLNKKRSDYIITENGNPVSSEASHIINSELGGSVLYEAATDGKQDLLRNAVRNHIEYLKKGDSIGNDIIDVITKAIAKIDDNPKLSISKFLSEVPSEEKYRFETLVHGARRLAKSEGRRATIADVREMCVQHRAPFLKQREQYLAEAAELEKLDVDSLNIKENEGQLFEVDIPENDVLLDEQKTYSEQPEIVQAAMRDAYAIRPDAADAVPLEQKTGNDFYNDLAIYVLDKEQIKAQGGNRAKAASLWLNDHGVKGITYEGRIDGRCFVVFDDKAIGILNTFYARNAANGKAEVAGSITPLDDQYFIRLMRGANLSTLAHESAHAMFLHMRSLVIRGQADERLVRDYETLQKWTAQLDDDAVLKKEYDTYQKDAYGGRAFEELTADEKLVVRETAAQEWLARGFEEYLREGKAPTKNLAGIFRRFAKWLTRVYRTLATLNISVPDDVRAVFDRMLASEEDIDAAAEARDVKEASAGILDALGLQGADRLQVQGMIQDAKDAAAESLRRERRKEFMEKREQWENEADEEMADDPVYKARESMRKRPISYSTLADVYGEDMAKALAKKLPGSVQRDENVKADAEAPMNPEELALAMGFENAGEMVQAILDRPGKTERKKELVAQKAREAADKYDPDDFLFEQEGLAEQQDKIGEALYRMEESGRTQAGAPVQGNGARAVQRVGRDQLRTLAGEWLDAKSAKDATSPHMFRMASAKAMREERRAILAHDWAAAIKANWQARINLELARQAAERRDLVLKIARGAKRFVVTDKADTGARYGVFCLSMLGKLFDPTTKMLANAGDKTHADVVTFLDRMQEEGYYTPDAGIPDTLFRGEPKAWREQAWTDVQPRLEAIAVIMHIERASRKANDELNKESWRAEMDAIADSILSLNSHREPDAMAPKSTILGKLKGYHAEHLKADTIALLLDGDQDMGPAWRAIIRPINQATWKRNERMKEEGDKLRKIFSVYSHKELMEMRGKRIFVRELNKAITKEQMIAILLNCGNESNKDRLMRGNNLTEEQIQAVIDKLDERDVRFVQNIWDYFETFRKESFDIEERLTGARPKAIPASPVVTKYGILRGGYYPVAYDSQASSKPIDTESIGSVTGSMFPAVDHGSMKSRTAMGLGTALNLSLDVVPQHVTKTLHMIAFREPVQKVARVLNDRAVNAAIESTAGVEQAKALKDWLHYVAGERPANNGFLRRLAGGLRKNTALFTMGFKLTTMLAQMTGLLITVSEIGLKWTLLGVGKAAMNPLATWRFISSMSPMMRNRINAVDRDVYEASQKMMETGSRFAVLDVPKRIQALMEKKAFIPMAFVQMSFCDAPTWMGAYHKGLEMFAGDRQQAAEYADTIVERTQVGGADKDLAGVQRGDNLHKLVSMYYSFFSALYQVAARRSTMLKRRRDAASVYRLATFMLLALMAEPVLSALLTGHGPEDDEEPIPWAIKEMFFQPFNMFIGVRDLASIAKSKADGFDGKYRPSAALDSFNSIAKFVFDMHKAISEGNGDAKKLTVEGGRALGQATGWVAFDAQMMLMLENFWSWLDGSNPDMELADILKKRKKK